MMQQRQGWRLWWSYFLKDACVYPYACEAKSRGDIVHNAAIRISKFTLTGRLGLLVYFWWKL